MERQEYLVRSCGCIYEYLRLERGGDLFISYQTVLYKTDVSANKERSPFRLLGLLGTPILKLFSPLR